MIKKLFIIILLFRIISGFCNDYESIQDIQNKLSNIENQKEDLNKELNTSITQSSKTPSPQVSKAPSWAVKASNILSVTCLGTAFLLSGWEVFRILNARPPIIPQIVCMELKPEQLPQNDFRFVVPNINNSKFNITNNDFTPFMEAFTHRIRRAYPGQWVNMMLFNKIMEVLQRYSEVIGATSGTVEWLIGADERDNKKPIFQILYTYVLKKNGSFSIKTHPLYFGITQRVEPPRPSAVSRILILIISSVVMRWMYKNPPTSTTNTSNKRAAGFITAGLGIGSVWGVYYFLKGPNLYVHRFVPFLISASLLLRGYIERQRSLNPSNATK